MCNISFKPTEHTIFLRPGYINIETVELNEYLLDWSDWTEEIVGEEKSGSR